MRVSKTQMKNFFPNSPQVVMCILTGQFWFYCLFTRDLSSLACSKLWMTLKLSPTKSIYFPCICNLAAHMCAMSSIAHMCVMRVIAYIWVLRGIAHICVLRGISHMCVIRGIAHMCFRRVIAYMCVLRGLAHMCREHLGTGTGSGTGTFTGTSPRTSHLWSWWLVPVLVISGPDDWSQSPFNFGSGTGWVQILWLGCSNIHI